MTYIMLTPLWMYKFKARPFFPTLEAPVIVDLDSVYRARQRATQWEGILYDSEFQIKIKKGFILMYPLASSLVKPVHSFVAPFYIKRKTMYFMEDIAPVSEEFYPILQRILYIYEPIMRSVLKCLDLSYSAKNRIFAFNAAATFYNFLVAYLYSTRTATQVNSLFDVLYQMKNNYKLPFRVPMGNTFLDISHDGFNSILLMHFGMHPDKLLDLHEQIFLKYSEQTSLES